MNPITNAKNLNKLNERELNLGLTGSNTSWHNLYEESAWIFVGGLAYDITEGDVIAVFSQYGEIVNLNLVRDKKTGKSKGYCFICYEDQRSTILAVDNFNGIKLLNRIIRVDHVKDYKMPKEFGDEDELTQTVRKEGCGPDVQLVDRLKSERPLEDGKADKKKKQIKVKTEEFSNSDRHNLQQNRTARNQNAEVRHEMKTTTVKVKEEPNVSDYEMHSRGEDSTSKGKNQSRMEEHHKEKSNEYHGRHQDKTKTRDNTSEESDPYSRNRAYVTSEKYQQSRSHQTNEKLERKDRANQRDRNEDHDQVSELFENEDERRERGDRGRHTDAIHRDTDRTVSSHWDDVATGRQSRSRYNYADDELQRRSHKHRSNDWQKRSHSSSSDEDERRKRRRS